MDHGLPLGRAIVDKNFYSGLLTVVGVLASALITTAGGYVVARRSGLSNVAIANLGAQPELIKQLILRLTAAETRADALTVENSKLNEKINHLEDEIVALNHRLAHMEGE